MASCPSWEILINCPYFSIKRFNPIRLECLICQRMSGGEVCFEVAEGFADLMHGNKMPRRNASSTCASTTFTKERSSGPLSEKCRQNNQRRGEAFPASVR